MIPDEIPVIFGQDMFPAGFKISHMNYHSGFLINICGPGEKYVPGRPFLQYLFSVLNRLKKYKFGGGAVEVVRQWGIMYVNQKAAGDDPAEAEPAAENAGRREIETMKDFFEDLGKRLGETAETMTNKAGEAIEIQRLKSQSRSLARGNAVDLMELGKMIYDCYKSGEEVEEAAKELCEAIQNREKTMEEYDRKIAKIKGSKECRNCGRMVAKDMAYCPYCGEKTAEEEDAGDVFEDESEASYADSVKEKAADMAESAAQKMDEAAQKAGDMAEKTAQKTGDMAEKAAQKTGDMAEKAAQKAGDMAEKAAQKVSEAAGRAADKFSGVAENLKKDSDHTEE